MGTIESLLPIVDDFERALETPGIDPKVQQGLEMIWKRIFEVFERAGLKRSTRKTRNSTPTCITRLTKRRRKATSGIKRFWKSFRRAICSRTGSCGPPSSRWR